jgi:catechol 2,3-dioxygenase-like lactoylglutathione lyase family enzyme
MKRLHVHVGVESIDASVRFYSALFAAAPVVVKDDYAKWMLDDPRVNFAISTRGSQLGTDHFGIQAESKEELDEIYGRLRQAGRPVLEEGDTVCCYAQSQKAWIADPQGVPWEAFLTTGASTVYGGDTDLDDIRVARSPVRTPTPLQGACCAPKVEPAAVAEPQKQACCGPAAAAE